MGARAGRNAMVVTLHGTGRNVRWAIDSDGSFPGSMTCINLPVERFHVYFARELCERVECPRWCLPLATEHGIDRTLST